MKFSTQLLRTPAFDSNTQAEGKQIVNPHHYTMILCASLHLTAAPTP